MKHWVYSGIKSRRKRNKNLKNYNIKPRAKRICQIFVLTTKKWIKNGIYSNDKIIKKSVLVLKTIEQREECEFISFSFYF